MSSFSVSFAAHARPLGTMPLHIIVSGAPASGKGTQCQNLKDRYNLVHISTGDALRYFPRQPSEESGDALINVFLIVIRDASECC